MPPKPAWDQYGEYLAIDSILNAQHPQSMVGGSAVHDEMLFIQFHQIYELWFKQILFELDDVLPRLGADTVSESDMQPILTYLGRIVEILKQMESMIDVLETMPPQSFIDFREYLGTASGFQSAQFRLIETRLGLERKTRLCVFHGQFDDNLKDSTKAAIKDAEKQPTLFAALDRWLARTPFVHLHSYTFANDYRMAVYDMFAERINIARTKLSGEALAAELEAIEKGKQKFEGIFDEELHAQAVKDGHWRLSWKALQAALFITIYRDTPILQAPYALLTQVMNIDALLARWRLRHALMVQRMVGMSLGTGGSSGYEYLMATVTSHRIFTDFFALSTYLIPSRALPPLPDDIRREMNYTYTTHR